MNSDFKDLLSLFNQFRVRYLVAGGYAVMYYSEPRYTKDLDIVIGVLPSDIEGTVQALNEFGFPMSTEAAYELKEPDRMIVLGRPPFRIDILNCLTGVDFDLAWERRNVVKVDEVAVNFISLQDLILAKRAAGRPQDLMDLANLEPLVQDKRA